MKKIQVLGQKAYCISLMNLTLPYLKSSNFEESEKYFKEYFKLLNIQEINSCNNLFNFIYPFVKYAQCAIHIKCDEILSKIDEYAKNSIDYFKTKFEEEYFSHIEKEHNRYIGLKEDEDEFTSERYYIFKKIFIDEKNIN